MGRRAQRSMYRHHATLEPAMVVLQHVPVRSCPVGHALPPALLPRCVQPVQKVRNLLPYMKKLPSKRVVKLENVTADPLKFSIAYNGSTIHGLPPGVKSPELAAWEVTGIDAVVKRYNSSGQVEAGQGVPKNGSRGRAIHCLCFICSWHTWATHALLVACFPQRHMCCCRRLP